jgi:hypothetical protein
MDLTHKFAISILCISVAACTQSKETRLSCAWQGNEDLTGYAVSASAVVSGKELTFLQVSSKATEANDRPAGICKLNSRPEAMSSINSKYSRAHVTDPSSEDRSTIEYLASSDGLYIGTLLSVCHSGMLPTSIKLSASSPNCIVRW